MNPDKKQKPRVHCLTSMAEEQPFLAQEDRESMTWARAQMQINMTDTDFESLHIQG